MLEIRDLTIQYEGQPPVLEHFNLSMKKGEIISIAGESGSGKTTVIRAILGALAGGGKITEGEILFLGESLTEKSPKEWRTLRGTKISMIFQDCGGTLNPIRKIGSQYVEYICTHSRASKQEAWNRAVHMLKKMHLPDGEAVMKSYPHQLSGGMRQRVGIAMAMTFQPRLLLADEPTSALDVTTQARIVRQMMELRRDYQTGIIMVTHNLGVLIGALIGINVFVVLIVGTVLAAIVGVGTGAFALGEMFQKMGEGVTSMYDITVISIIVAAIVALVKEYGGIEFILNLIKKNIKGARGGEFGISLLVFLVDCCTANNTVAIVMAGPIAKEISEEFDVSPRRSASLLDIFASVGQGMIPYGAQLLTAASLAGLSPVQIMPYLFYPILMGISAVLFILFRRR